MLRQMVMGKGKDWKWCELMGEPGQDSASERECKQCRIKTCSVEFVCFLA